jgi:hypothetical protein
MKPLPILAFLVTAAIGWSMAGNSAAPAKSADSAATAPSRAPRPERRARKTSGPEGAAARQLAAIRASRDPAARMRATVDLANTLPISEFAAWQDGGWFNIRGGAELTLFSKIFEERWRNEDPEGLVAWAIKNQSGHADPILIGWADTDPQRVLDFFKTHPDEKVELSILATVAKKNPTLALQRLQEMIANGFAVSGNGSDNSYGLLKELAKSSPQALEAALDSFSGTLKTNAEWMLIGSKMNDAFGDELVKLQDRPDGFKLFSQIMTEGAEEDAPREAMRDKLLADLSNLPESWRASIASQTYGFVSSKTARRWADADLEGAGFTPEQANKIRAAAVSRLYEQPEIALKLLPGVQIDEDNRKNLLSNIFRQLQGEPEKLAAMTELLPTEADREYVLSLTSPQSASAKPMFDTPADWLAGLAGLAAKYPKNTGSTNDYRSTYELMSATQKWDQGQRAELSRQFNALPHESKRAVAEQSIRHGFYSEPGPLEADAVRFLVANPSDGTVLPASSDPFAVIQMQLSGSEQESSETRTIQLASNYVAKLAQNDPTAAGEWIATLPAGAPRTWAQKNLNSLWSQYDPAAASQWLKSLPAKDRAALDALPKKPGG